VPNDRKSSQQLFSYSNVDANIMMDGDKISGVIDFGDSVERYERK
jgi:hypothetical protein